MPRRLTRLAHSLSALGSDHPAAAERHLPYSTTTMLSSQHLWNIGCLLGATGVGLGAFGAHALSKYVTDERQLKNWSTAAQYQLLHASAILFAASRGKNVAGMMLATGTVLFSGSIYALTLDRERFRWLGPVTPLGGTAMIGGWLALMML
ncbi:hypothetical protein THASP1DRAFT_34878 [Thamnocephalis sphaerospora]|uniref:DUF423-domain-containing protein n=1 Tax=Thamnocephalis sphaerospora TaxID=78915 RepID=A0A4P9XNL3_9FUNG|nr:hypothetical protein THASP1DRAFT_34878 [Thamnocephalis sphaerospora]|eukprot:RKP07554.1 hypothetical protein THASP1DRAFT_34878 [Thamnocephalis sphaerospora]